MEKFLFTFVVLSILLSSLNSSDEAFAWPSQYGIIKGSKVNLRSAPSTNSKVVRQLMNSEFVFYLERSKEESKVGADKDYWYRIRTTDNKQGWVFGKYFYYLDENKIPEKYYKYIIEKYILLTITSIPSANDHSAYDFTIVFDIDFNYLKDKGYVIFKYQDLNTNTHFIMGAATLFYKIENNIPRLVIYAALNGDKGYYFDGKYIFTIGRLGVSVYDTTREGENYSAVIKDIPYALVDSLHMRKWLKKDLVYHDSYVDFDEKNLVATMYLRDEKDQPMRIEKFEFINGKFEHLK